MKILFTGDINFRGKENHTFDESEKILAEVLPFAKKCRGEGYESDNI